MNGPAHQRNGADLLADVGLGIEQRGDVRELADGRSSAASPGEPLPDAAGVDALLRSAGFVAERWRFRVRLDQAAQRDLLKVPVLTDWLFPELDPDERATRLDAAYARADPGSWRWEGWSGWTATKPG